MAWELLIDRSDLARTEVREVPDPVPTAGQVVLRVDRVGVTANNVTYAVFGDTMHYWDFFPADDPAWGRVPLWGFAVVEQSTRPELAEGTRLFGYLPTSSHLVVEPSKVDAKGFRDARAHRQHLPPPYNRVTTTTGDPAYGAEEEDLQILYRPLFMTSFLLADMLTDHDLFGAEAVVISSASSKTAYGAAFLLDGVHRVGLTSARNREFVTSLGCYDEVRTYEEVDQVAGRPSVYVDIAGDGALRRRVHEHLVPVHSAVVGASHHDAGPDLADDDLPGAPPTFFFAPDRMRQRYADWGPDGVEEHHHEAWRRFAPVVAGWVDVTVGEDVEGLDAAWQEVLSGRVDARTGHVVQL